MTTVTAGLFLAEDVHTDGKSHRESLSCRTEVELEEQTLLKGEHLIRPFSRAAEATCRSYSVALQRRVTDFGAENSFAKAGRQLKEHYGLDIPTGAIRTITPLLHYSITQGHGERMQGHPQLIQGPGKTDRVQQLVVKIDGSMIPRVDVDEQAEGERQQALQRRPAPMV